MKVLKLTVDGLQLFSNPLDIEFISQQKVMSNHADMMYQLSNHIYQNTAIALIGINASGKTSTLKVISFVLQMLNNEPINKIKDNSILQGLEKDKHVVVETYFTVKDESLFKLRTVIKKHNNLEDLHYRYYIAGEELWRKEIKSSTARKNIFDFSNEDKIQERTGKEEFLPEDVSIIISQNKKLESNIHIRDLINWTNYNIIRIPGEIPQEIITFLDPNIESLNVEWKKDNQTHEQKVILKFRGQDAIILNQLKEVDGYLSSGTIKGINVFANALFALMYGGYLLLDELENHFNKEIAVSLIKIFMDNRLNQHGATIVFSTHYPEILDRFERNDNIYFVNNIDGIQLNNLAKVLTRTDLKKSDVYQSGYLKGTAPQYEAYAGMKDIFFRLISNQGKQNE